MATSHDGRRKRNAEAMATRCVCPEYRIPEQIADANQRRLILTDPEYRVPEQIADTNRRRRLAREKQQMATKVNPSSGTYLYHQPCGLWNEECRHGCGYTHLSSLTASTRKKCCANGLLLSASPNFDEELMKRFALDETPIFMRNVI